MDRGDTVRAGDYFFFHGKEKKNHQLGTEVFVHHTIVPTVKREEYVNDRMSYIVLRGQWCNLNLHAPSEEKSDDSKDSFCEELEQMINHFSKYQMKILKQNWGERRLSNRQSGTRVYIRILMIMVLE